MISLTRSNIEYLVSFAKAVDDKELRTALKKWDEFVPESGDTGEHLMAFFNNGILLLKIVYDIEV